ncbi:ComEC/Rec2 family competence protein [Horticoccus sp. 23ND18S-11]|uniref:ComEC/Rec2 family competence protein n=1 Tax=Horticoccus sp. 23ND18S-11 TaxID=3391832 RepID=UPI0039C99C62
MKLHHILVTLLRFSVFAGVVTGLQAQGTLTVTVLDFQLHGLAVVLKTPTGKTWLVDTGPGEKGPYYGARDVILPLLKRAGVSALDGVIISHPHNDHRGGLAYLVDNIPIRELVDGGYAEIGGSELETYRKLRARYVAGGGRSTIVKTGSRLALDAGLDAEILWPPAGLHRPDPTKKDDQLYNANSVVLRLQHGANVFLFPGDNHGLTSTATVIDPATLKCDLLVAPHHGLNSNAAMAELTRPKIVLVASLAQYQPSLIRPYELTQGAFQGVGSAVYATWVHGDITAVSDGKKIQVTTARQP